ncbi:hypothetical protein COV13_04490 [Candidatus Woesearchaeota archaeon CG10_big_fil_rev_8_21_14_0_10_32_9]|nr:MAG: hypothetical protein COV13_04490 [Candidatus Woesearchaeota archaeon CG10_big_fil_rev_8_21_14_0_10_32_9]
MADDKIKTILNNFKNDIGQSVSELTKDEESFGIDSSSGTRFYIISNYSITKESNDNIVIDGKISKSYVIIASGKTKNLIPVPKIIDKKIGTYHRRFVPTREVYSARSLL